MGGAAFRFLHASDLHLDQPVRGLAEIPGHLRDALLDAPREAAARVFEAAVLEEAAVLILSGDVLDVERAGAGALAFLLDQFHMLHDYGIRVVWAGGAADPPGDWPAALPLPENVCRFAVGAAGRVAVERDGELLATVVGSSYDGRRRRVRVARAAGGEPVIGVAYGRANARRLADAPVHYWALGGRHQRATLASDPVVIHYPGSCQGRSPAEPGPHGATLVHAAADGAMRLQFVETDRLRWYAERLAIDGATSLDDVQRLLVDRLETMLAESHSRPALAHWTLVCGEPLGARLREPLRQRQLLGSLRERRAGELPRVWSAGIDVEVPGQLEPAWYDEQTILGDYLRSIRDHEADPARTLDVEALPDDALPAGRWASLLDLSRPHRRRAALRDATAIGIDMLRGSLDRPPG